MRYQVLISICVALAISGCSSQKDIFYKHQPSGQPLEVPPDMTAIDETNTFEIPQVSQVTMKKHVLENGAAVTLKKDGKLRWIEVDASPDVVWEEVKDFWLSNNVKISWENQKYGIMETAWLKNYDSKYDRDRFRVRIEGVSKNKTDIYLTHRGKQQTFVDGEMIDGWASTYNDPELEIEVLDQMLSYMGLDKERKTKLLQDARKVQAIASLDVKSSNPHILISDNFNRSWRLCIEAVDRAGHVITVKNKAQGWFELRLVDEGKASDFVPGFALSDKKRDVLRIQLKADKGSTRVYVVNDEGQQDQSRQAREFLRQLNEYL